MVKLPRIQKYFHNMYNLLIQNCLEMVKLGINFEA
jgi:hypothetical protein